MIRAKDLEKIDGMTLNNEDDEEENSSESSESEVSDNGNGNQAEEGEVKDDDDDDKNSLYTVDLGSRPGSKRESQIESKRGSDAKSDLEISKLSVKSNKSRKSARSRKSYHMEEIQEDAKEENEAVFKNNRKIT